MAKGDRSEQARGTSTTWAFPNERDTVGPRKGIIYELSVLGELIDGPQHGYALQEILSRQLGPFRQISWGALYPLIRQLAGQELIELDKEGHTTGNRQRNCYRITQTGRERFFHLMLAPSGYNAETPELFQVKLIHSHHLTRDDQLAILRHYRGYLQAVIEYAQGAERFITNHPGIPEHERSQILRAISYKKSGVLGEAHWLDAELARWRETSEESSQ